MSNESYPLDLTKELKQASEKVSNEIVHALNTLGRNLQGRDNEEKVEDEECCFVIVDDDTVTGVCRDGDDTMEAKDDIVNVLLEGIQHYCRTGKTSQEEVEAYCDLLTYLLRYSEYKINRNLPDRIFKKRKND